MRAILTYHSIDSSGSPISIGPDVFEDHLALLTSDRVRVVSIEAIVSESPTSDRRPALAVTFDDGFANAGPAARRLADAGLPCTVFVVSGHVGGTNAWRGRGDAGVPTLPLLDWMALSALATAGVTIGAHTRTHPRLTTLTADEVAAELDESREAVAAHVGEPPRAFAYPYGDVDASVASAVAARFRVGVSTDFACLSGDDSPARLPRLDAYYFQRRSSLATIGTSAFARRVVRIRLQRRVRAVIR